VSTAVSNHRRTGKCGQLRIILTGCAEEEEKHLRGIVAEACGEPHIETIRVRGLLEARLTADAPDLILACEAGSAMDAMELLTIAGERSPRTAVIVYSHAPAEAEAIRAIELGAAAFVELERRWEVSVAVRRVVREFERRKRWESEDGAWAGDETNGANGELSPKQALEARLRRSQKMEAFGKLAGGVAHDFNNLLTIITGYNEVLMSEMAPEDPNREYIEEIARAANRASALTSQLLAFSRQQKMQPRVVNLNEALSDTSKMLSRLIGEDIDMRIVEEGNLGNVKADVGQIEQVVMNLAVNARDAMPGGGTITMSTRNEKIRAGKEGPAQLPPGEYVVLEVSDTGTGMSPEVQARIFEPFFTTKAPCQGTGLGLATCYGIVKQSGGEIIVQSRMGCGTTFQIYLPRVYEEVKRYDLPQAPEALPTGDQTILIVEDELPVRVIIRSILQRLKYTVLEAANGAEAMRMLLTPGCKPVDLLMTDLVMPEMGGKELVKRMLSELPEMRIIMISGYPVAPSEDLPPGTRFLPKPFTPKDLAEAVRDALTVQGVYKEAPVAAGY